MISEMEDLLYKSRVGILETADYDSLIEGLDNERNNYKQLYEINERRVKIYKQIIEQILDKL